MRLNKTKDHATITPTWHGASYKQDGRYFDANGDEVDTPNSPKADRRQHGEAKPLDRAGAAEGRPAPGPTVRFLDPATKNIAFIDNVEYVRLAALQSVYGEAGSQEERLGNQQESSGPKLSKEETERLSDMLDPDFKAEQTAEADRKAAEAEKTRQAQLAAARQAAEARQGEQRQEPTKNDPPPAKADDLTKIHGIGQPTADRLAKLGLTTYQSIAALTRDEIDVVEETLGEKGRIEREGWIASAVKILAETRPGSVVRTADTEQPAKSELTKEDLVRWAKKEGPNYPWYVTRQAFFSLLAVKVTNEDDAVAKLVKEGLIAQEDVKR